MAISIKKKEKRKLINIFIFTYKKKTQNNKTIKYFTLQSNKYNSIYIK